MGLLLEVKDLATYFYTDEGIVKALDGVSFSIDEGEILGLVGETGCGKSVTATSIMGLIPSPPGRIVRGSILFNGRELLSLSERQMRSIRGREIAMIFQDPAS
ncbi:MAG: ABC transporter ATP-binding protein, partial [Synergistales bacterium]|nr:ABC transporter ATP-binding protein [Synergistales bacterium]